MNSKITSLARTVALLAIISGFAFLIWDVIKGCTCHCNWIFGLLLLASIILFILWVRDMIGSDNEENQREHEAISKSGGYSKPTSSSTYEPDTKAPEAKITEASIKKAAPKAKTAKVELSEEDKAAKLEVLKNIIGVANGQDDLKKVLGIGPVYEKKLHTMVLKPLSN